MGYTNRTYDQRFKYTIKSYDSATRTLVVGEALVPGSDFKIIVTNE